MFDNLENCGMQKSNYVNSQIYEILYKELVSHGEKMSFLEIFTKHIK